MYSNTRKQPSFVPNSQHCSICEINFVNQKFRGSFCNCGVQICMKCTGNIALNGNCPNCKSPLRQILPTNPSGHGVGWNNDMSKNSYENGQREKKVERKPLNQSQKNDFGKNKKNQDVEGFKVGAYLAKFYKKGTDLTKIRVIQKDMVYVIGLSPELAKEGVLGKMEYCGQYGQIVKIAVNTTNAYNSGGSKGPSYSAYITYSNDVEASVAILAVDQFVIHERTIRASFGTTKYCAYFLRDQRCPNPECLYLHNISAGAETFAKDMDVSNKELFQHQQTIAAQNLKDVGSSIIKEAKLKKFKAVFPSAASIGDKLSQERYSDPKNPYYVKKELETIKITPPVKSIAKESIPEFKDPEQVFSNNLAQNFDDHISDSGIGNSSFLSEVTVVSSEFELKNFFGGSWGDATRKYGTQDQNRFKQTDRDSENPCEDDDEFPLPKNFNSEFPPLEKLSIKYDSATFPSPTKPIQLAEDRSTNGGNTVNTSLIQSVNDSNILSRNDESIDKKITDRLMLSHGKISSRFDFVHEEKIINDDPEEDGLSNILRDSFHDYSREIPNALEISGTPSGSEIHNSTTSKQSYNLEGERNDYPTMKSYRAGLSDGMVPQFNRGYNEFQGFPQPFGPENDFLKPDYNHNVFYPGIQTYLPVSNTMQMNYSPQYNEVPFKKPVSYQPPKDNYVTLDPNVRILQQGTTMNFYQPVFPVDPLNMAYQYGQPNSNPYYSPYQQQQQPQPGTVININNNYNYIQNFNFYPGN